MPKNKFRPVKQFKISITGQGSEKEISEALNLVVNELGIDYLSPYTTAVGHLLVEVNEIHQHAQNTPNT